MSLIKLAAEKYNPESNYARHGALAGLGTGAALGTGGVIWGAKKMGGTNNLREALQAFRPNMSANKAKWAVRGAKGLGVAGAAGAVGLAGLATGTLIRKKKEGA